MSYTHSVKSSARRRTLLGVARKSYWKVPNFCDIVNPNSRRGVQRPVFVLVNAFLRPKISVLSRAVRVCLPHNFSIMVPRYYLVDALISPRPLDRLRVSE